MGDPLHTLRAISILFSVIAIFSAGFTITVTHLGVTGMHPMVLVSYWYDIQKQRTQVEEAQEADEVKYLLMLALSKYTEGVQRSKETFDKKQARFTTAVYAALVSFCALLVWLAAKFYLVMW